MLFIRPRQLFFALAMCLICVCFVSLKSSHAALVTDTQSVHQHEISAQHMADLNSSDQPDVVKDVDRVEETVFISLDGENIPEPSAIAFYIAGLILIIAASLRNLS